MFTFDIRGKHGILIFTLYNYRLGEGREYHAGYSTQKRLNSFAFYNIDTNDLKIVHYDYIKARIYNDAIGAYTINLGEKIIALKGLKCYYLDHTGQEIECAGDNFFFYNYKVDENWSEESDCLMEKYKNKQSIQQEESNFKIDGNKIIHNNGEIYESNYLLKEKFKNNIICYTIDEKEAHYEKLLYGICDNHGSLLSEIKYDEIWTSCNQIIREKYLRVKINGKFGIISYEGQEILPVVYEFVDDFYWYCND